MEPKKEYEIPEIEVIELEAMPQTPLLMSSPLQSPRDLDGAGFN